MRKCWFAFPLIFLCLATHSQAQSWSGILNPTYGTGACTLLPSGAPAECAIDWSQAGIPGGVPSGSWTQSGSTILASQTPCNNGSGDCTSTIQAALNSCGANQYVLLGAGTFAIASYVTIHSDCELRGAGADQTIISATASSGAPIALGEASGSPNISNSVSITGGAAAGSTSIVVSKASGLSAGSYLIINELNNNAFVTISGGPGGGNCTWCDGGIGWNGTRVRGQIVQVTSVSGTTIGIMPPLYTAYGTALPNWAQGTYGMNAFITNGGHYYDQTANNGSPYTCTTGSGQPNFPKNGTSVADGNCTWLDEGVGTTTAALATPFAAAASYAGVQALQIYGNHTGFFTAVEMNSCAYCWAKGIETNWSDGNQVTVDWGFGDVVRDSYFSNDILHTPGTSDSDVDLETYTSQSLVENNILERLHVAVMQEWGAAGNVVAYNYMFSDFDAGSPNFLTSSYDVHGAHPQFNLIEGNVADGATIDSTWGGSSHGTLFRNWLVGTSMVCNPTTTGNGRATVTCSPFGEPGGSGVNSWYAFQAARAMAFDFPAVYYNAIGNVLGSAQAQSLINTSNNPLSDVASITAPTTRAYDTVVYGFSFGYSGSSDSGTFASDSPNAALVTMLHGNYNNVDGSIHWLNGITQTLPPSFYLAGQPAWWPSTIPFPAVGPDVTTGNGPGAHTSLTASNPAQNCYLNVMGGSDGGPGSPLTFNANNCYGRAAPPPGPPTGLQAVVQ